MDAGISDITIWLDRLILVYSVIIMLSYTGIWVVSGFALRKHKKKEKNREYEKAVSIVENIKALMHIPYNNYEVIVVNDGSHDKSLDRAIEAYKMERVHFYDSQLLVTKRVRGVYHSSNPAYWLVFEWMAPWEKVMGLIYFLVLMAVGSINWSFFLFCHCLSGNDFSPVQERVTDYETLLIGPGRAFLLTFYECILVIKRQHILVSGTKRLGCYEADRV